MGGIWIPPAFSRLPTRQVRDDRRQDLNIASTNICQDLDASTCEVVGRARAELCNGTHSGPFDAPTTSPYIYLLSPNTPPDLRLSLGMCASDDAHMPITKTFTIANAADTITLAPRSHSHCQLRCRPSNCMCKHAGASPSTLFTRENTTSTLRSHSHRHRRSHPPMPISTSHYSPTSATLLPLPVSYV
ncbi:uncharacterized protein LACBIDRAFT_295476 [Laccaria bicolor S238N-H82]|uniref:Predicted protein n=1 Tax=Laccaria bicolor (strain S238N-H82 / ATCC MYA-4686) TaxID=486041 RepID=B0DSW6_LACBS|nr:uncharacterized protein LACBIDRAFT_295476 [Laccaria bicolor S238N-H82]EDR02385.1 predicted protein [Laccaria bicolor S238N-H82]|eukprot:XP_001887062.1 predicted protein [Laccaria bicolor S238N-H82]